MKSSVQSLSCVRLFATPWIAARQASLSITNSWSPPKPMSIESIMPSNHLILCHALLLLLSIFPSIRGLFQWVGSSHWVAKILALWPDIMVHLGAFTSVLSPAFPLLSEVKLHPTIEITLLVAKDFHPARWSVCVRACVCVCVCARACVCVWRGEDMNQNEEHLMSLTINFLTVSPWWSPPDSSFIPDSTPPFLPPPLFLLAPCFVSGLSLAFPFLSTLSLTEFTHSFSSCSQPL